MIFYVSENVQKCFQKKKKNRIVTEYYPIFRMEYRKLYNIPYSSYEANLVKVQFLLCYSHIYNSIDHLPAFLLDLPSNYNHYLFFILTTFFYFLFYSLDNFVFR